MVQFNFNHTRSKIGRSRQSRRSEQGEQGKQAERGEQTERSQQTEPIWLGPTWPQKCLGLIKIGRSEHTEGTEEQCLRDLSEGSVKDGALAKVI